MRSVLTIILYGLALGLAVPGVACVAYGFWQDHTLFVTDQGLQALGVFINAMRFVMVGLTALVLALALAVAGGRAREV